MGLGLYLSDEPHGFRVPLRGPGMTDFARVSAIRASRDFPALYTATRPNTANRLLGSVQTFWQ